MLDIVLDLRGWTRTKIPQTFYCLTRTQNTAKHWNGELQRYFCSIYTVQGPKSIIVSRTELLSLCAACCVISEDSSVLHFVRFPGSLRWEGISRHLQICGSQWNVMHFIFLRLLKQLSHILAYHFPNYISDLLSALSFILSFWVYTNSSCGPFSIISVRFKKLEDKCTCSISQVSQNSLYPLICFLIFSNEPNSPFTIVKWHFSLETVVIYCIHFYCCCSKLPQM